MQHDASTLGSSNPRDPVLSAVVTTAQKNILGLVQGPPCRIDVDFKDEKGRRYTKTAVVKGKNGETEELPLYTNHDNIYGEVRVALSCCQHLHQHTASSSSSWCPRKQHGTLSGMLDICRKQSQHTCTSAVL